MLCSNTRRIERYNHRCVCRSRKDRSQWVSNQELLRSTIGRLQSAFQDPTLSNNWAQVRSKHLLDSVSPEVAASTGYSYSVPRLKRASTSALHTALLVLKTNPAELHGLSDSLQRAAEVMEYLADLPDETRPITTRVISAGLYQLAGYEANSLCIARALPLSPLLNQDDTFRLGDLLDRWTILALRRQLLRLRVETEQVTQNRERLERLWIERADEGDSSDRLLDLAGALLAADMYGSLVSAAFQGPGTAVSFQRASEELSEFLLTSGRAARTIGDTNATGCGGTPPSE